MRIRFVSGWIFFLLLCASVVAAPAGPTLGLVGQRFFTLGGGQADVRGVPSTETSGVLSFNMPVAGWLDLRADHDFSRSRSMYFDGIWESHTDSHASDVRLVAYLRRRSITPFLMVGYAHHRLESRQLFAGFEVARTQRNAFSETAGLGAEVVLGSVIFTPSLEWRPGESWSRPDELRSSLDAHRWFSKRLGGFVLVTRRDLKWHDQSWRAFENRGWQYRAGLRIRL